jgi:hypothetical protein
MTTTSNSKPVKRSLVSLKLPTSVPALITATKGILNAMTNNPAFANPNPPLATVSTALTTLETAETSVKARTHGAVAGRNTARKALVELMDTLKGYIQTTASANPDTAHAVIQSAGVGVRKAVIKQKQAFTAKDGAVSGTAKLTTVSAGHRASYEWQYSLDTGKTWQTMPVTLQARTSITGLAVGATVLFRGRAVTKTGEGDWTQPAALVVR